MLLTELHGYKQYKELTLPEILIKLQDLGLPIKSGAFGICVLAPNAAYKIWVNDWAYDCYLKRIIMPLQGNAFVPKVLKKVRQIPNIFNGQLPDINMLVMEKLENNPGNTWTHLVPKALYCDKSWAELITPKIMRFYKVPKPFIKAIEELPENQKKDFIEWFDTCVETMQQFTPDTNPKNVMKRGDVPVFIDSYYD